MTVQYALLKCYTILRYSTERFLSALLIVTISNDLERPLILIPCNIERPTVSLHLSFSQVKAQTSPAKTTTLNSSFIQCYQVCPNTTSTFSCDIHKAANVRLHWRTRNNRRHSSSGLSLVFPPDFPQQQQKTDSEQISILASDLQYFTVGHYMHCLGYHCL